MLLGFKEFFHDGKPTFFKKKILAGVGIVRENILLGIKIHTIREGERWKPGYFIHMATGVRTKGYNQFNSSYPQLQKCISTQQIFMSYFDGMLEITVDNTYLSSHEIDTLIQNDGLTRDQFINWFFKKNADVWSGQIIHWTNFKY